MKTEIQFVLEVLHVDAAAGCVTSAMQRPSSSSWCPGAHVWEAAMSAGEMNPVRKGRL
jgi:hypothetical protein